MPKKRKTTRGKPAAAETKDVKEDVESSQGDQEGFGEGLFDVFEEVPKNDNEKEKNDETKTEELDTDRFSLLSFS